MNVVSVTIDCAWLLLAAYGLRIQWLALKFARRNWAVARVMPLDGILVMAHARLRSNRARLSVIITNALIGVVALVLALTSHTSSIVSPPWVAIVNVVIAVGFTINELFMIVIARLEVGAHRRLVKHGHTAA